MAETNYDSVEQRVSEFVELIRNYVCNNPRLVNKEIHFLFKINGCDKYLFLYDDENRGEMLRVLKRFASNPRLESFDWNDSSFLSKRVIKLMDDEEKRRNRIFG